MASSVVSWSVACTVQLLDGPFSACLALSKSCLAKTVQILDAFFSVARTVPLPSVRHRPVIGRSLSAVPQLDTVQLLAALPKIWTLYRRCVAQTVQILDGFSANG